MRYLLDIVLAPACLCILACAGCTTSNIHTDHDMIRSADTSRNNAILRDTRWLYPLREQQPTELALRDYLKYSRSSDRLIVQDAAGVAEIPASRVFRAFHVYSTKGSTPAALGHAERVLFENTYLTLSLLYPILFERPSNDEQWEIDNARDTYLNLCGRIAAIEHDRFARTILSDYRPLDAAERRIAKRVLSVVDKQEHWKYQSRLYKEHKGCAELQWLVSNYLEVRAASGADSADEVCEAFGEPDYVIGDQVKVFKGLDVSREVFIWMAFSDCQLQKWKWGQSPAHTSDQDIDTFVESPLLGPQSSDSLP